MGLKKWGLFEKYVAELMEEEQIPGMAVALSQNGKTIYERGFGVSDLETKEPITPDTVFGIASITKTFIALAIMKLVKEGKLQVEDAVNRHLPNFQLAGHDNLDTIKIHHLLSHTTGIPTLERKEEIQNFDDHLKYLRELEISRLGDPGDYFCYNNDMFLLLGAIIEKVTGENYKEFIKNEVFIPQNMTRTTFELDELGQLGNVTTPYRLENEKPTPCPWPTLGNYAVGGGIRSSVTDLLKYGNIYMDKANRFANKMTKPVHRTNGTSSYGYGIQMTPDYFDVTLAEHGGSQPGVSSNFGFIRERGLVAVVLTNMRGVSADAIWLAAVNSALGLPIGRKRHIEPHYDLKKEQIAKFIGTYTTSEGSKVKISSAIGKLQATIDDDKTYILRASNEETLVMTPIERPIRFFFNADNETWALFLGMRMFLKTN